MTKIIGYFHICQIEGWQRSFDLIYNSLLESGLYEASDEIRIGIVNNEGRVIPDERLNNTKFNIVYVGICKEYERPTLLHMRLRSKNETCNYWYLHSKGLRHFNTEKEASVLTWIDIMLYWNCYKWNEINKILDNYDTYGCLYLANNPSKNRFFKSHYSGNFWWATSNYIKSLPDTIGTSYIDPETWILLNNPKFFNSYAHTSRSNYYITLQPSDYKLEEVVHRMCTDDYVDNIPDKEKHLFGIFSKKNIIKPVEVIVPVEIIVPIQVIKPVEIIKPKKKSSFWKLK